jgi:hypothetical protein
MWHWFSSQTYSHCGIFYLGDVLWYVQPDPPHWGLRVGLMAQPWKIICYGTPRACIGFQDTQRVLVAVKETYSNHCAVRG